MVWVPVSDVDRAKAFYAEQLGFNVDHDVQVSEGNRIVELTPPGSGCSIVIGEGTIVPGMPPGSLKGLQLVVRDIHAAPLSSATRGGGRRDPGYGENSTPQPDRLDMSGSSSSAIRRQRVGRETISARS